MLIRLILASAFVASLGVAAHAQQSQPAPSEAPQINAQQEPDRPLKSESETTQPQERPRDVTVSIPQPITINLNQHGTQKAESGSEEGTEYWPVFLGLHLKITGSLLALFTLLLVIATGVLGWSTIALWRVTRDEFIATHRPKLRVFAFQLTDWETPHAVPISVLLQAQNIGETPARVFRVQGRIFVAPRNMPLEPGMLMPFSRPYDVSLASGERDLFGIDGGPALTEMTSTAVYAGQTPIICVGRISYRDDNQIERHTGFARRFVIRPHRSSERISDPDYEYEY